MLASKPSRGNFVAMPIFIADLECGVRFLKSKTLADTKNTLSLSAFTQTNAEAGMVLLGGFIAHLHLLEIEVSACADAVVCVSV